MKSLNERVHSLVDSLTPNIVWDILKAIPGFIILACAWIPWIKQHLVLFLLVLCIGFGVLLYAGYSIVEYLVWGCKRTRKYVRELQRELHPLHPGIRPAMALMAYDVTYSLLKGIDGENITLKQYMKLIDESLKFSKIDDVTFIAATDPEAWSKEEDLGTAKTFLWYLWKVYFRDQENKKMDNKQDVRMRRIFISEIEPDVEDVIDPRNVAFAYLKKRHEAADIDLFWLPAQKLPVKMREDLALFGGAKNRKWMIKSNYQNHIETVDARVLPAPDGHDYCLSNFYELIYKLHSDAEYDKYRLTKKIRRPNCPKNEFLIDCGVMLSK